MKTLSDFKKACKIGTLIHGQHHGNAICNPYDMGIRAISIVQSNSIAFATLQQDGKMVDSWISFPKASECTIKGDTINIFCLVNGAKRLLITYKLITKN